MTERDAQVKMGAALGVKFRVLGAGRYQYRIDFYQSDVTDAKAFHAPASQSVRELTF